MRRSLVVSLLVHGIALAAVLRAVPDRRTREAPSVSIHFEPAEVSSEPQARLIDPVLSESSEFMEPVEVMDPSPVDFEEVEQLRVPLARVSAPMRRIPLSRPLRESSRVKSEPASVAPSAPIPVARPVQPRADGHAPPRYPPLARRLGQEGTVVLALSIDREGRVTDARLRRSSGHPMLDRAALKAARAWRYRPALDAGRPVAGELVQPVEFRLQ